MKYQVRTQESHLRQLLKTFPGVLLLGPRQCGKSTMVRKALPDWPFFDLERPADMALLQSDLEGFLEAHPKALIIDEAQRSAELFTALRYAADRSKKKGRFVLLGSASPALIRNASETLAGRVGLMELTPFLAQELSGTVRAKDRWFWGGSPPVHALRGATVVLERDLPALGIGLPPTRLRTLVEMFKVHQTIRLDSLP